MSGVLPLFHDIIKAVVNSNGFVLELGIHAGTGSTIAIQHALKYHPDPLHISCDWDEANIKDSDRPTVPWWHFIVGDSRSNDTFSRALGHARSRRPGVIFVDTDHNFLQMAAELELWGHFADDWTVWLMHDITMYGPPNIEMVRAIKEYAVANRWVYDEPRIDSHGLGRMKR